MLLDDSNSRLLSSMQHSHQMEHNAHISSVLHKLPEFATYTNFLTTHFHNSFCDVGFRPDMSGGGRERRRAQMQEGVVRERHLLGKCKQLPEEQTQ